MGNEVETGIQCNPPLAFEKYSWLAEAKERLRNESTDLLNTKFVQEMRNVYNVEKSMIIDIYLNDRKIECLQFSTFSLTLLFSNFDKQNPSTLPSPLVLPSILTFLRASESRHCGISCKGKNH